MDEIYVTYVDDEHVDNHDYDDTTDDDHDNNNDIYARAFNARVNTGTGSIRKYKKIYEIFVIHLIFKLQSHKNNPENLIQQ